MSFQDADYFNAINGNQFIADLMPKHPVYIAMLNDDARSVIGVPHPTGRAAMRMLEDEGFRAEGYVDIFDGGPTMVAWTDNVTSVKNACHARRRARDPCHRPSRHVPRLLWRAGAGRGRRHRHRQRQRRPARRVRR